MTQDRLFSTQDWIVHSFYGVGQIEAVETKTISGEKNDYFRVKTTDSTYWLPIDQAEDDQVRSLATPAEIDAVIAILKKSPEALSSNAKIRQTHIKDARVRNTLQAKAGIIRDFHAYYKKKGMSNVTEHKIYRTIRQRFVKEWSLATGKKSERVEARLETLLSA